jgi:hypothetical protein
MLLKGIIKDCPINEELVKSQKQNERLTPLVGSQPLKTTQQIDL